MTQPNQMGVIITTVVCALILLISMFYIGAGVPQTQVIPVYPTATEIATLVSAGIVLPKVIQPEFPDFVLSEEEYDENLMETEAERLVIDELDSKNFRELLMDELNDKIALLNGSENEQEELEIDSYRDIEDIYSVDMEDAVVDIDAETGEVKVEFKVKYTLDDDEDLVGKARVTVTYDVDELVVEDEFEDAEVDEDFTLEDIYLYKSLI